MELDVPDNSRPPRGWLVLASLTFALSYVALAAAGYGSWRGLLADPARGAVCAALVALAAATPLCGCHVSPGERVDRSTDWVFPPLLAAGLAMGWAAAYGDRHGLLTLGGETVRWLGVITFVAGAALRVAAIRAMGPRFTVWVAIQPGHTLQTTGLYRLVRHPSYAGAMLTLVGWALAFRSGAGLALALTAVPTLLARGAAEERLLAETFGPAFDAYRARTWRLVPWVY